MPIYSIVEAFRVGVHINMVTYMLVSKKACTMTTCRAVLPEEEDISSESAVRKEVSAVKRVPMMPSSEHSARDS